MTDYTTNAESTERAISLLAIGSLIRLGFRQGSEVAFSQGIVQAIESRCIGVRTRAAGLQVGSAATLFCKGPDALYAFPTLIAGCIEGQRFLWLVFVGPFKKVQRRKYQRVEELALTAKAYRGRALLPNATILDLSAGGIRVKCSGRVQVGESLTVMFGLPGGKPVPINAQVVVRRTTEGEFGAEFSRIPEQARQAIVSWIFEHTRARVASGRRRYA